MSIPHLPINSLVCRPMQEIRTPLLGRTLLVARTTWGIIAALAIVFQIIAMAYPPMRPKDMMNVAEQGLTLNLPQLVIIGYPMLFNIISVTTFVIVGLMIFWSRSDDWVGITTSLMLLTFSVFITPYTGFLALHVPSTAIPLALLKIIGQLLFVAFLYTFPDGRFVPPWSRWLLWPWALCLSFYFFSPFVAANRNSANDQLFFVVSLCFYVSGFVIQVYRQQRMTDPVKRQQTKWVQVGLTVSLVSYLVYYPFMRNPLGLSHDAIFMIITPLQNAGVLFIPLSIAISVHQFRLWDIDPIINRALVYATLTGLLGLVYVGCVILLQSIFPLIIGSQSSLTVVISTLAAATLFRPWRARLQHFVDRRFYREKVDAQHAFTEFARELRMYIELPDLLRSLVMQVSDLLHITYGAVYLRDAQGAFVCREFYASNEMCERDQLTPIDVVPIELRWLTLNPTINERLCNGQAAQQSDNPTFPMLVPLLTPVSSTRASSNDQPALRLLGVLALGPRLSRQTYSRDDEVLLMGLADQAGTGIYVARLIDEREHEVRRQEEVERKLEEYRHSPAGRAEAFGHELLAAPESALLRIHELAQAAGRDPAAASLVSNLPAAFNNLNAGPLMALAKWANFTVNSQYTPELLPVGLRTLITTLDSAMAAQLDGATLADSVSAAELLAWPDYTFIGSQEALLIYRFAQAAIEANSLPAIVELGTTTWSSKSGGSITDPKITTPAMANTTFLADLQRGFEELRPVVEALRAYERVDMAADKLAYLASAIERLRRVEHLARVELGGADRPVLQRIVENWASVVTSTMLDLQTRAQVNCQLLTRQTWREDIVALALSVRNTGRGAALNVRVSIEPASEYTLLDEIAPVARLAPNDEAQVGVALQLNLPEGSDRFRARFTVRYNDPRGSNQVEQFADVVQLLAATGEFQFIPNPYVVGTPLQSGSPLFFGRADVVEGIQENLAAGHRNNLVLIGQRRTGKTSLLKQLPARLGEEYLPVYLDGQTLGLDPGLANFFLNFATEIAFALEDRGFVLEPPEPDTFEKTPATTFEREFLPQVRTIIGNRHLLILLDEFEELEAAVRRGNLDASIFGFLRHMIQHVPNLSVIFCGTHRLEELASDYWNVLFNISLYRHIGFLEREEAVRLIQEPVARFGMVYDDLSLDKIWRVTAGHPYFQQLLCHSLVNRHNRSRRSYVTIADVNAALDEIMASGEAHFVYLWSESSHDERLALVALSRMLPQSNAATPAQVVDYLAERGVHVERRAIGAALHHLALRDILSAGSEAELALGESFRWQLGLLGLWVEKYRSLGRVVDETRVA